MSQVPSKYSQQGFTLIELMIVVVIVAILAAVAFPSYQRYIQKTQRVDARETLMRMATIQERFFFQNSRYTTNLDDLGGDTSPEGWYTISISDIDDCTATVCNSYTLTATPVSPGPQSGDVRCTSLSIDETLAQTATGSDADNCWQ